MNDKWIETKTEKLAELRVKLSFVKCSLTLATTEPWVRFVRDLQELRNLDLSRFETCKVEDIKWLQGRLSVWGTLIRLQDTAQSKAIELSKGIEELEATFAELETSGLLQQD